MWQASTPAPLISMFMGICFSDALYIWAAVAVSACLPNFEIGRAANPHIEFVDDLKFTLHGVATGLADHL